MVASHFGISVDSSEGSPKGARQTEFSTPKREERKWVEYGPILERKKSEIKLLERQKSDFAGRVQKEVKKMPGPASPVSGSEAKLKEGNKKEEAKEEAKKNPKKDPKKLPKKESESTKRSWCCV